MMLAANSRHCFYFAFNPQDLYYRGYKIIMVIIVIIINNNGKKCSLRHVMSHHSANNRQKTEHSGTVN